MPVERTTTDRGFTRYGSPVVGDVGTTTIEVIEALMPRPACTVQVDDSFDRPCSAHLDRDGVLAVIERLQAWLDDHPEGTA